jgi:hypothetical protein
VFMTKKVYKELSDCLWTFLATSLEELITRDHPGRPMRTLVQKLNIFRSTVRKDGAGGLETQILCYKERLVYVIAFPGKEQDWLKKNSSKVWEKKVWLPSKPDYSLLDYFVRGISEL